MLRVHLMPNWFALSDPATEEALHEIASLRTFAELGLEAIPDETAILSFRHLLESSHLAEYIFKQVNASLVKKGLLLRSGSIVGAMIIAALSSTKSESGERDPEMHQTKTDNQWHIAGRPSDLAKMPEGRAKTGARKQECQKAGIRDKVKRPFRVIKRQRKKLMEMLAQVRPQAA